jgi:hypothetical protein
MAIVRAYFHRTPARIAPHLRYIATRDGACGLQGLGRDFRALRGDVDACTQLLEQHAARARQRAGTTTREGAFVRLLFTLPPDTATRVSAADARLPEGSRLVLRDAIEATFRSVGRDLQGVYAIHFHAARREAHGHVHVDLSPLDIHGRPTFVTDDQRDRFRTTWAREVARALERVERRAPAPTRDAATPAPDLAPRPARPTTTASTTTAAPASADVDDEPARTLPVRPLRVADNPHAWTVAHVGRRSPIPQRTPSYMRFLAGRLLAATRNRKAPLLDLFLRSFVTRVDERWRKPRAPLGVRFALGFPVPHILVRTHTPVSTRTLRLPFTS